MGRRVGYSSEEVYCNNVAGKLAKISKSIYFFICIKFFYDFIKLQFFELIIIIFDSIRYRLNSVSTQFGIAIDFLSFQFLNLKHCNNFHHLFSVFRSQTIHMLFPLFIWLALQNQQ